MLSVVASSCYEYEGDANICGYDCKVYVKGGQHFVKFGNYYYPCAIGDRHEDGTIGVILRSGADSVSVDMWKHLGDGDSREFNHYRCRLPVVDGGVDLSPVISYKGCEARFDNPVMGVEPYLRRGDTIVVESVDNPTGPMDCPIRNEIKFWLE